MTHAELDRELRAIADAISRIQQAMPEMTGLDLAYDRGNVSHEDWQAAQDEATACMKRQEQELQRIEQLRAEHPELVAAYLTALLERLAQLGSEVDAGLAGVPEDGQDPTLRFNRSLLPDLIERLAAWREGTPSTGSLAWAWRMVHRVADETAGALARQASPQQRMRRE